MTWTGFNAGRNSVSSPQGPPLLCSDGNVYESYMTGASSIPLSYFNTSGFVSSTGMTLPSSQTLNESSALCTDGTYIYCRTRTLYPQNWVQQLSVSGHVSTYGSYGSGSDGYIDSIVIGGTMYSFGGSSGGSIAVIQTDTVPTPTAGTRYTFTGSTFSGFAYDGTNFWCVMGGTTTLLKINKSTFAGTTYTLPVAAAGYSTSQAIYGVQIGYDGTHLYIPALSGGVIVWNISGGTGTNYNSGTTFTQAFYSTNQSVVFLTDGANTWTMPAGGGSLTSIGNLSTILGYTAVSKGFCDGLAGVVWTAGIVQTTHAMAAYYTPAAPATTQIVMIT